MSKELETILNDNNISIEDFKEIANTSKGIQLLNKFTVDVKEAIEQNNHSKINDKFYEALTLNYNITRKTMCQYLNDLDIDGSGAKYRLKEFGFVNILKLIFPISYVNDALFNEQDKSIDLSRLLHVLGIVYLDDKFMLKEDSKLYYQG